MKDYFELVDDQYVAIKSLLNNTKEPVKAIGTLQDENTALKKQIEKLLKDKAKNLKGNLQSEITECNGIQFLAKKVDLDPAGIKDLCFELGQNQDNLFLLFGAENKGKALLTCYVSKELVASKNINAGQVVRELGKHIQGGGGGQPFFATAGGRLVEGIEKALENAKDYII